MVKKSKILTSITEKPYSRKFDFVCSNTGVNDTSHLRRTFFSPFTRIHSQCPLPSLALTLAFGYHFCTPEVRENVVTPEERKVLQPNWSTKRYEREVWFSWLASFSSFHRCPSPSVRLARTRTPKSIVWTAPLKCGSSHVYWQPHTHTGKKRLFSNSFFSPSFMRANRERESENSAPMDAAATDGDGENHFFPRCSSTPF